jgi:GDP-4-dehydro-6-deoxy-D-mannose reductase
METYDLTAGTEASLVQLLNRKQPEVIYHLAAQSNPSFSLQNPRRTWDVNLGGTLNLLEAVRHASLEHTPRLVLVSSGVCYGNPQADQLPVREDCPLLPNNPYAASKAASDLLGIQSYLAYRLETIVVRPFNHAGPRQSPTYVLPGLALQIAKIETGQATRVEVGNLEVIRDFTDVRDVVASYRLLAVHGKGGEVYNLGSGTGTKLADALDYLISVAHCPISVHIDAARVRAADVPLLVADTSKLRRQTGWQPKRSIQSTLNDMLNDFRETLK